jgi:TonB family protein
MIMELFAFYFLKSAIWLIGFTLVYLIFLQRERFFRLKRVYLIMGILLSLALPLVTFHYNVEMPGTESGYAAVAASPVTDSIGITQDGEGQGRQIIFSRIMIYLYVAGILFFVLRSARHIRLFYREIRGASPDKIGKARLIRTEKYPFSFSFFNYIFINPSLSEEEAREILNHELVHLRQKHWFDLLLVELVALIQWVNPFVWVYSGLVRQNHENLADEEALQRSSDPANYRAALLNQVFSARLICLSNSFNFSFNLNRFEMMKKKIVSPYRKLKILFVLPVFAIVFYAFSMPEYTYAEFTGPSEIVLPQPVAIIQKLVKGVVYNEDGIPFPGVNVDVSGTSLTVTTDTSGRFEFRGIPENVILVFTHKGYKYLPLNPVMDKVMIVKMIADPDYIDPATARPDTPDKVRGGEVFVVVEKMPAYPGGDAALFKYIYENVKYPPEAKEQGIQGKVILRFMVTSDGAVEDITVIRGVHPLLDAEAIRVMSIMPLWIPGTQGGKPVNVWYSVPISFTLSSGNNRQE